METVQIQIPEKLTKIVDATQRYIVLIGGRSSAKSMSVSQILMMKCDVEGSDLLCGREFQTSIDDSVHKLNCNMIKKLDIPAEPTEKKINFRSGAEVRYKGFARDPQAVKSAEDFKRSWIEEAQDLSQQSIDDLLPTIRAKGSQLFFTANPQASLDPFSQRFIIPFKDHLDRYGIYEDELHLIIKINWRDNPWHDVLEKERLWDFEHKSRAEYDHIWEGAFNDGVENAIINAEWFDACIDAHIRLGFKPRGERVVAYDPSDTGNDAQGLVDRYGNVIMDVKESNLKDINDGCDWATDYAIEVGADLFTWDGDGMGVGIKRQVANAFEGKKTDIKMFKGSESPEFPDMVYEPDERFDKRQRRKNRDTFSNKRAQFYWKLRDRIYKTYRAVEKGEYTDPNELLSISSKIKHMEAFRSEVCRIPTKSNGRGLIQIMTKEEMLRLLKITSPNMADSAMMSMNTRNPAKAPDAEIIIPKMKRV